MRKASSPASRQAALQAALTVATPDDAAGKVIVVVLADTGERYITTDLFAARARD